ncbi:unnamed protein product, partial [Ectocarpus sp. 6 AP-2014]
MEAQPVVSLSKGQLYENFAELEHTWKTPGTPEGMTNLLRIFSITCAEDMTPQKVLDKYNEDWHAYGSIRRDLDILQDVCGDSDEEEDAEHLDETEADMEERFCRFQDNIWYGKETMLSFFRMTNSQQSFPPSSKSTDFLFWMQPMDEEALKPAQKLILFILGSMHRAKYKRHGERVYEQIFIDGMATRAWQDKCSILNQIQTFSAKETSFQMWQITTERMDATVKYLTECQDIEFPDINRDRRAWSFNDGIYNASDDTFCLYAHQSDDDLVTSKLIRMPFAGVYFEGQPLPCSPRLRYDNIPTPLFESIFAPQKWDADMVRWLFVFIGRLFYRVNEADSWQVIPFLKGVAGTGKSTVIKVIQAIYSPAEVGVLSNNVEKKFGLSALVDKTLFIVPEVKSDCQLDQAEFQSIVTGEELSLAVKHETPWCGRWTVPGIMAGNEAISYVDNSGSISRRIAVLDFPNRLRAENIDPTLLDRLLSAELPGIIRKSAIAYHRAVEDYGDSDIWVSLPPRVIEERNKLMYSTNPLYSFINSDRVELDHTHYCLESIFISQLKVHSALKFTGVSIAWNEDFYQLLFADYDLEIS